MERIFKIKIKSNPDPHGQYPSERRYSASIVIGLSVVYLQLFFYSVLMGSIIIHKMAVHPADFIVTETSEFMLNITEDVNSENNTEEVQISTEDALQRLEERVEKDLENTNVNTQYYINIPAMLCAGCFIMALGTLFSFVTGIIAWKQWYIDHNITFFFLSSSLSTLTSSICFLLSLLTTINMKFDYNEYDGHNFTPITFSLVMNILILSSLGVIWSFLSSKVAYKGMKTSYPDDIMISKGRGTVEVNTVRKGSKNCSPLPPDIINHFPASGKLAKYLPKKENNDLPKAESNYEYQQRVNKFLSGEPENTEQAENTK